MDIADLLTLGQAVDNALYLGDSDAVGWGSFHGAESCGAKLPDALTEHCV